MENDGIIAASGTGCHEGRNGGAATGYESLSVGSTGRYGHSTDDEVGDFAEAVVKLRRFDGLVEFFRRLGDLPVDIDGTVHYDPRGSGILARILTSALEEVPKQQLIALAVQGGVACKRKKPKEDIADALGSAAEETWSRERVDSRKATHLEIVADAQVDADAGESNPDLVVGSCDTTVADESSPSAAVGSETAHDVEVAGDGVTVVTPRLLCPRWADFEVEDEASDVAEAAPVTVLDGTAAPLAPPSPRLDRGSQEITTMQGYAVPASEATIGHRSNVDDASRMLDLKTRAALSLRQIGIAEAELATARDGLGDLQEQLREGEEELRLIAREKKVAGVGTPPAARSGKGQSKREHDLIIARLERMTEINKGIAEERLWIEGCPTIKGRNKARAEIRALQAEYELLEAEAEVADEVTSSCKPKKAAKKLTRR